MGRAIAGVILLIFGGVNVVRPDIMVRFQIWSQRRFMGAQFIPSQRTYQVDRFFGVFFVCLGLLLITRILK